MDKNLVEKQTKDLVKVLNLWIIWPTSVLNRGRDFSMFVGFFELDFCIYFIGDNCVDKWMWLSKNAQNEASYGIPIMPLAIFHQQQKFKSSS